MSSNDKPSAETIDRVLSDEGDVRSATSVHQSDFPYDREEEAQVTRREFCNFLGVTSAALFVGATGFAAKTVLESNETELVAPAKIEGGAILAPGSALNFRYPTSKDTAILVRLLDGSYRAFGQKCTHLSCPVYFDTDNQRLECPCHEGAFDVESGNVLHGPPPRPLDQIRLDVKANGEVWAVGRTVGSNERVV